MLYLCKWLGKDPFWLRSARSLSLSKFSILNSKLKFMSQKFKKLQNSNDDSTAFGKWFATAVYDQRFITTAIATALATISCAVA